MEAAQGEVCEGEKEDEREIRGSWSCFCFMLPVMDFVRESVKHKRLVFILNWIGITHFFLQHCDEFQ